VPGTALPGALTQGYNAGLLTGGVLYLAALVVGLFTLNVKVSGEHH